MAIDYPDAQGPFKAQWVKVDKSSLPDEVWAVVDANGQPVLYGVRRRMLEEYITVDVAALLNKA